MGRYEPSRSRSHHCECLGRDEYFISWEYDRYYTGSRLRFPTRIRRYTNEKGARKFCKRWKIEFPEQNIVSS